jgi:anti-sigma regulatory factor (Ser/Thr protein kinase)
MPQCGRIALAAVEAPGRDGAARRAWAEVVALGDDRVGLVVADGAPRAVPVVQLRRLVAEALRAQHSPARALEALDQCFSQHPGPSAGTALCAVLDGGAGVLLWSGAGLSAPLVVGPDGRRLLAGAGGLGLGRAVGPFGQAEVAVEAGATVVLAARGADDDGFDELAAAAAVHHELAPDDLAALLADTGSGAAPVLLLARLIPAPLAERLPADPRRLPALRRRLGTWSALAGLSDDTTADLQLMFSEAATNSVEHAYRDAPVGEFVYSVRRREDGGIRVEVQDFGRWRPPPADPGYRGRGLAVIHKLADEVTLEVGESGTRVAFTVPGDPPPLAQRRAVPGPAHWWPAGSGDAR